MAAVADPEVGGGGREGRGLGVRPQQVCRGQSPAGGLRGLLGCLGRSHSKAGVLMHSALW